MPAQKAPRTTYEAPITEMLAHEDDNIIYGLPHFQSYFAGVDFGCRCGKVYTKAFALRRHIAAANGSKYSCEECSKCFSRKDSLRRHEETEHRGNKRQCPGCQHHFRKDSLMIHLATPQFEACRIAFDTLSCHANGFSLDVRPVAEDFWTPDIANRVPHRTGGRAVSRSATHDNSDILSRAIDRYDDFFHLSATLWEHLHRADRVDETFWKTARKLSI